MADKKDGKVNKGIFDIHVIDVYFTTVHSNPRVFDTGSVAMISNSTQELQNEHRLVKDEVAMCGVIVVDAESFRSTCHGRDAYIHDHCLRYRHNYALFYQMLDSNLFTHRMFSFKREAASETYAPGFIFHDIFSDL